MGAQKRKNKKVAHNANGVKDKRYRLQERFWLDGRKDHELSLWEELQALKRLRKMQATLRNALRLFFDLRAGRTEVLQELFPGIVEVLSMSETSRMLNEMYQQMAVIQQQQQMSAQAPIPRPGRITYSAADVEQETQPVTPVAVDLGSNLLASLGLGGD